MNKNTLTLNKIKVGECAKVIDITPNSKIKRRLLDLGITPNSKIDCAFKSPFNDPVAYLIRGTVIALRAEDAKDIIVEPYND